MTSTSWGIQGKHQSKDGGRSCENRSRSKIFEGYYAPLLHTGDTNEADNPMCQDILINVIFGCESELWRLQFGMNQEWHRFLPVPGQCMRNVGIKHNVTFNDCNCFINKIPTEMFIKSTTLFYWSASYKK